MNPRKTKLWLALTGWLPWRCLFGHHKIVDVYRGWTRERFYELNAVQQFNWRMWSGALLRDDVCWIPINKVCKRCGKGKDPWTG